MGDARSRQFTRVNSLPDSPRKALMSAPFRTEFRRHATSHAPSFTARIAARLVSACVHPAGGGTSAGAADSFESALLGDDHDH